MVADSAENIKRSSVEVADEHLREIKRLRREEPKSFKRKGNEIQFNSKLQDTLEETKSHLEVNAVEKVKASLSDKSEFGWKTVEEYTQHELADSEDEGKKIRRAEERAEKALSSAASKKSVKRSTSARRISTVQYDPQNFVVSLRWVANETRNQDLFQHMKNDDSTNHDAQTLDSATADQAKEQEKVNFPDTNSEGDDRKEEEEDDDYEMKSTLLEDKLNFLVQSLRAATVRFNVTLTLKIILKPQTPDRPKQTRLLPPVKPTITTDTEQEEEEAEAVDREEGMETSDSEEITADRLLSTYHSSEMAFAFEKMDISSLDPEKLRSELEKQLAEWSNLDRGTSEEQQVAQEAWHKYELLTTGLSQELCEQLRLVLEPSLATKLKGDYRSGKRLNMRKVIPYIASQFRKDKIWLRRTKPSKRQYQIMLAVDDSSSMNDNHSKQLAFESLAVMSNALSRLEAGDLGVCSFGETVRLLHPFHEPFTDQSGARVLQQFTFDQQKTKVAQLLDTCTSLMLTAQRSHSSPRVRRDTSQLLLIVSDGRGIFLEGMETVQKAVRVAREANIFMVFVILDNPANKDSVLDIRVPIFSPGKPPEIKSYMEQFPFPFYIILREINALPQILSDALRQWFELVASID
ncbi:midasin-like [Montipora foliosa]|uniref:midasin-like n=1 Tax=Montipora foliosa TaxID=591990 RepID=UPI0035F11A49